jgi:hypothetical protein
MNVAPNQPQASQQSASNPEELVYVDSAKAALFDGTKDGDAKLASEGQQPDDGKKNDGKKKSQDIAFVDTAKGASFDGAKDCEAKISSAVQQLDDGKKKSQQASSAKRKTWKKPEVGHIFADANFSV